MEAWLAYESTILRPTTLKGYENQVTLFINAWPDDEVWTLNAPDIWRYIELHQTKCGSYIPRALATGRAGCKKGLQPSNCNPDCPGYKAIGYGTMERHLNAIVRFYDYLLQNEIIHHNPIRDVRRRWANRNRHRRPEPSAQVASMEQVQALTDPRTPIQRRTLYATLAKTGLRISEAISLRIDPQLFNLDEGWMKIPDFGGKRKGNRTIIIDKELRLILEKYLSWRKQLMSDYSDAHDYLFITQQGNPLNPNDTQAYNRRWLKPDLKQLAPNTPPITLHAFRHYFSNHIKRAGIDSYWFHVLRGDKAQGTEAVYIHPTRADIRKQYQRFRPTLGRSILTDHGDAVTGQAKPHTDGKRGDA